MNDEAMADVLSRGRDAPDGWYPILSTCTISDAPEWRSRLAKYRTSPGVVVHAMPITANPTVTQDHIDQLKAGLPPRAFRMRVLALEEPPERATYPDFTRKKHCRPIPQIGAIDCTARVTNGARYLIGYDPGVVCDVSVILRCFTIGDSTLPYWWVTDEVVTRPGNPNKHASDLARYLHRQYKVKPGDVSVRCDPHTNRDDGAPIDVYYEMKAAGFRCQPAVYKRNAKPSQAHRAGSLLKNPRIQVVNTLLLNARDDTRLYLDVDETGLAKATETAVSLEMSQRDEFGRAEMYRKGDISDISHPTCALGYALYTYEHARPIPPVKQDNGDS